MASPVADLLAAPVRSTRVLTEDSTSSQIVFWWRKRNNSSRVMPRFLSTRLALGGAFAHAYELPIKIGLLLKAYFVQRAYDGWSRLGYVLAIRLCGILTLIDWRCGLPSRLFWVWTFPATSRRRTGRPDLPTGSSCAGNGISRLAGAVFQVLVMALLNLAVPRPRPPRDDAA